MTGNDTEKLKSENNKLTLELNIIRDEYTAEKLLYKQHVIDLEQTIILNHINNNNDNDQNKILYIDTMTDKNKKIIEDRLNEWKLYEKKNRK